MTLRMVAGLKPSRLARESTREPTGSPVEINVSTMAVRISRSRSPIGCSGDILLYCICFRWPQFGAEALSTKSNSFENNELETSWLPGVGFDRNIGTDDFKFAFRG